MLGQRRKARPGASRILVILLITIGALLGATGAGQASVTLPPQKIGTQAITFHQFVNRNSGKCMVVTNGSHADNATVVQNTCSSVGHYLWRLEPLDSDYYLIIASHSAKCLTVLGASQTDGADTVQQTCHGAFNQHWQPVAVEGPYVRWVARHSGMCLVVDRHSLDDDAVLQQAGCGTALHKQWRRR
jgi:hypothetical protein